MAEGKRRELRANATEEALALDRSALRDSPTLP